MLLFVTVFPLQVFGYDISVNMMEKSFFKDSVATAIARFPGPVDPFTNYPEETPGITIIEVQILDDPQGVGSLGVIRWMPMETGLVTLPALDFFSETAEYRTIPHQVRVGLPQRTDRMQLILNPSKTTVYAGEPVRLDVSWKTLMSTRRLRSLICNPDFFSNPDIEVVVPRSTAPEKSQLGVPISSRRVIAQRIRDDQDLNALGEVNFTFYLRFSKPGTVVLDPVMLECAHLHEDGGAFAPYASYFNNALFDPVDAGRAYDRLYTESNSLEIQVLPLPEEGKMDFFSGLFAPCEIDVSVRPQQGSVGQLMEADFLVRGTGTHGMLELPEMRIQPGLMSKFRVDPELGRKWDEGGTLFRMRFRPLTTQVKAFPALQVQVFDPELGDYRMLQTAPVPLSVVPLDGKEYFDVKTLPADATSLTDNLEGVWQNDKGNPMNDVMNAVIGFLAGQFWLLVLAGPVMFLAILPIVRERRRWANDPVYRERVQTYRAFRKLSDGNPAKWRAFQTFLATSFDFKPEAWTSGDAQKHLAELGLEPDEIDAVVESHQALDAGTFAESKSPVNPSGMDQIAGRVFKLLGKSMPVLLLVLILGQQGLLASDWDDAEALFDKAIQSEAGLPETNALYSEAALKFQAAAEAGQRPGAAYYNAGNAWFEAGMIGRSIACYRMARIYRPFDEKLSANLRAVRALALDVVQDAGSSSWLYFPVRWLSAVLVITLIAFWILLLVFLRYQNRRLMIACLIVLGANFGLAWLTIGASLHSGKEGVVAVTEVYGRKGPSYSYQSAFNEPLHDGLEFKIEEARGDWIAIRIADNRVCWIPSSQVQLIRNPRS
ncbi:MAG: hypothetical protein AB3N63_09810 [Puniceicoccaceae bacterium]